MCVAINKAERIWRSEEYFDVRHRDAEFGVSPAVLGLVSVQYFLTTLPSLCIEMVMYILCHDMSEVCDLVIFLF